MKKWGYIGITFLLLASCEKRQLDDCITSRGSEKTITRLTGPFHQIRLTDKFDVVLVQNDSLPEMVTITGGRNLFKGIDTKVENGILYIEDKNSCNFVRSLKEIVKIEIRLKEIDRIDVQSVVGINTTGVLKLKDLSIFHSGLEDVSLNLDVSNEIYLQSLNSGALKLSGRARKIKGSVEEISFVDARFLDCEQAYIDSHTRLDCYVNPSKILFVKIYNEGNIWYVREPSDIKEINVDKGSGKLLKL